LSNKFKNGHENFSGVKVSIVFLLDVLKLLSSEFYSLWWETFFITVFEIIGQFFFQNDVFNLQEVFSEHEVTVFLEKGLGSFQTFLLLQISDKPDVLKTFQKQF
jgi:hypothetical protein